MLLRDLYRQLRLRRWQRQLFNDRAQLHQYRRLLREKCRSEELVSFQIKQLGGESVWCRPGSTDAQVLLYVFQMGYHLPPIPLRSNCVIYDLGANIGLSTAHFAHLYPGGRVIGVEMDEANHKLAMKNTDAFRTRCEVVRAAVWTEDGVMTYGGTDEEAYRLDSLAADPASSRQPRVGAKATPAKTMETLIRENRVEHIDYLKMDVEGAERAILADAGDWISRVRSVKVEWHEPATQETTMTALRAHGFDVRPDEHHWACVVGVRR